MYLNNISTNELTDDEKILIRLFRHQNGQHGIIYSRNHLEFTDGVATTWITSEDEVIVDIFAKIVNWKDDNLINYYRKRAHEYKYNTYEIPQTIYLVIEQIDDTHTKIRKIFSTEPAAKKYKKELVDEMGGEDYSCYFFVEQHQVHND